MDKLRKYFSSEETGGTSSDTGSSTGIVPDVSFGQWLLSVTEYSKLKFYIQVSVLTGDDSQDECCPCKMSFMERVKWFAVCFGIGCLISILVGTSVRPKEKSNNVIQVFPFCRDPYSWYLAWHSSQSSIPLVTWCLWQGKWKLCKLSETNVSTACFAL